MLSDMIASTPAFCCFSTGPVSLLFWGDRVNEVFVFTKIGKKKLIGTYLSAPQEKTKTFASCARFTKSISGKSALDHGATPRRCAEFN